MWPLHFGVLAVILATGTTAAFGQGPRIPPAHARASLQTIREIFDAYCGADDEGASRADGRNPRQPAYCPGDSLPDAVKWLVLRTDCWPGSRDSARPYCTQLASQADHPPLLLEYNHERGGWSAMTFGRDAGGKLLESGDAWRVSADINGIPTITRGDPVPVIVSHTNPLLYGYTVEATKLDDLEGLGDMKAAVAGLGSFVESWVAVAATTKAPPLPATDRFVVQGVDPLTAAFGVTRQLLTDLVRDTWELDTDLDRTSGEVGRIVERIADVERSRATGLTITAGRRAGDGRTAAALDADRLLVSFEKVDREVTALTRFGGSCRPLLYAFILLGSTRGGGSDLAGAKQRYLALNNAIEPSCGLAEAEGRDTVVNLRGQMQMLAENIDKDAASLDTARKAADAMSAVFQPDDKAEKEAMAHATQLLTRRGEAGKILTRLTVARARQQRFTLPDGRLLTWFYVERRSDQLPWDKQQTHAFTITADSVYADAVARTRTSGTDAEYRITPQWPRGFGVGLGLTYTKLAEPTWDAVSEPPGSDTKVIRQTGSHARAGHVVLFVDYNWFALLHRRDPLPVEPVTQIGTSVSSTPGLFLGAGVQMFRVARLTGGWTWQRVPELNGQKAGDTVAGNDDIRTRDHFTGDWYIALTFALDWLPVFKK